MTGFHNIVICFVLFSFFGWMCETAFCSIKERKYVNRGFLSGPFCPIYGFGGLIVVYLLAPLRNNIVYLFCMGLVATTLLEYATSWVLEKLFQTKWWDYTGFFLNIHGRVCLKFSLIFGALSVVAVKLIYPPTARLLDWIPDWLRPILGWGFMLIMVSDTVLSVRTILQLNGKLAEMNRVMLEIREKLEGYGESSLPFYQRWEKWREEREEKSKERPSPWESAMEELAERLEKIRSTKHHHRRLMRAFPHMRSLKYQDQLAKLRDSIKALKNKREKK